MCRACWLDDFSTVFYSEVPSERETANWISNTTARLVWRKLEITLHVLEMGIGVLAINLDTIFMKVSCLVSSCKVFSMECTLTERILYQQSCGTARGKEEQMLSQGRSFQSPPAMEFNECLMALQSTSMFETVDSYSHCERQDRILACCRTPSACSQMRS